MSLLFFDGFDVAGIEQYQTSKGWNVGQSSGFYLTTGRFGGYSWIGNWGDSIVYRTTNNSTTLFVGFALKISINYAYDLFAFYDGASTQIAVKVDATGKLYFTNGAGTVLTDIISSSVRLVPGVWSFVEIMVTINNSIGSNSNIIRIDEVEVCNLASGQDTQATANAYTNKISYKSQYGGTLIDDFYLCDSLGTTSNTFLGDIRVTALTPTGNGNYSQFVGSDSNSVDNYLLVDELPVNTADYVSSSTPNQIDSYVFSNMPSNSGDVYGVICNLNSTKSDAGIRKVTPLIRIGSTDYLGTEVNLVTPWNFDCSFFELDPSTSAAWSKTNIDNAEFGFKVTT